MDAIEELEFMSVCVSCDSSFCMEPFIRGDTTKAPTLELADDGPAFGD